MRSLEKTNNSVFTRKNKVYHSGFSLMEILIVLSIMAIFVSVAGPSMSESIKNSKIKELSNEFTTALYLTQSESIKRGVQVTIVPLQSSGGWQTGWNIFEDVDRNGVKGSNEKLIQTHSVPADGLTLKSKDSVFTSWLAFLPSGAAKGNAGMSGGFRICRSDNSLTKSRTITIQGSGNVIVEKGTVSCP